MSELLEAAVAYAGIGWKVFPVNGILDNGDCTCAAGARCTQPGKHPAVREWNLRATDDVGRVRKFWSVKPQYNVAVACGSASGFMMLDVDPRHGGDTSLAEWEQVNGTLPDTVWERTGGGGRHYMFQPIEGITNTAGTLAPGLDTRTTGGYVIVAPSRHASGSIYTWEKSPLRGVVAPAPEWLVKILTGVGRAAPVGENRRAVGAGDKFWRDLWINGMVEGGRDNAAIKLAGYLLRRKLDAYMVLDMLLMWNKLRVKPPLPESAIEGCVDSAAMREYNRIMRGRKSGS